MMIFYLHGNRKIAFQYIFVALVERKKEKKNIHRSWREVELKNYDWNLFSSNHNFQNVISMLILKVINTNNNNLPASFLVTNIEWKYGCLNVLKLHGVAMGNKMCMCTYTFKIQNILNQNMGTHQILRILMIGIYWTFFRLECAYNFNASTFYFIFLREGNAIEDYCPRQWWMQNGQEHVK